MGPKNRLVPAVGTISGEYGMNYMLYLVTNAHLGPILAVCFHKNMDTIS